MVVEYSTNEKGFVLAGKCSAERGQIKQIHRLGFKNYELFIGNHKELEDIGSLQKRLQENYKEFGLECVSVHSPNSIVLMKPDEVAYYIGRCQDLADSMEGIQQRKPAGVVLHELRGEYYPDFQSKIDALHTIFDSAPSNAKILPETPACEINGKDLLYLSFPEYLDDLVKEMNCHKNFRLTFDIDHAYETLLFHGIRDVYKTISDIQLLSEWNDKGSEICERIFPGIGQYFAETRILEIDNKKFDERILNFKEKYGPVLLDDEEAALENFRGVDKYGYSCWDELEMLFGIHAPDVESSETGENHRPIMRGQDIYPQILSRMVGRYISKIGLFHFTGSPCRIGKREERERIKIKSKFDYVEVYPEIVYLEKVHTPFFGDKSSLELQLPLLIHAGSKPIVLEAMLDDTSGKKYFEKGSLLF